MKKRICSVLLSLLLVVSFCVSIPANAIAFTPNFDINSSAGLLINLDTQEVVYQKNSDTQYMPGSLVQIMEAIVVLENCKKLGTRITADSALWSKYTDSEYVDDVRFADIKNHDVFTVEELLYAMMLTSSVEASVLLANQFGNGSISAFVDMMNAKATELGCTQTNFTNVTGVYDISQKTTADDLAKITLYALNNSKFETIATTVNFKPFSLNTERHEDDWSWTHSNLMMLSANECYYEGARGIKTANLSKQGRNIVTMASRDGNHFLVILLAAPFEDSEGKLKFYHIDDARSLFDWVFEHFTFKILLNDNAEIGQVAVKNGSNTDYVLVKQELVDKGIAAYKEIGIKAHGYVCDVTNEAAVNELVAKIEKEVGVIDILVNNAGIIKRIPMCDMTAAEFRQVIDVDLNAPFIVSKAVIPSMIKKGHGKIINICSMMSELGRETVSAYAAAKGGLKMLTKNIASEYGEFNIQCNGIGPGYIATPQTAPLREIQPDGSRHPFDQFIIAKTPAARWGNAEDLQGPAVFLASDASNFVNGHILYVDGGILAYIGKQPK